MDKIDKNSWKPTNFVKIPTKNEPFSWMFSKITKRLFYDFWPASVELMVQSTSNTYKKTLIPTSRSFWAHLTSFKYCFLLKTTFNTKIAKNHRPNWPKMANFVHVATSFSLDPTQRAQWVGQSAENLADCFHRPHKQDGRKIIWRTFW